MAMAMVTSISNWLGREGKRYQWKRKNRVRVSSPNMGESVSKMVKH
jgi:hypothetical protein